MGPVRNFSLYSNLRELFLSCWKYRVYYALAFFLLLVTNGFAVLIPYMAKLAVDQSVVHSEDFLPYRYPLWILCFAFCQFCFRTLSRICVYRACREQEHDLRTQLMSCLEYYPLERLQETKRGDLVTNMIEDTSQVRALAGFGFIQVANIFVAYAFCVPMMVMISPRLTLVSVLFYPVLLVFIGWMNQKLYYQNLEVKQKLGDLTDFCSQVVEGIHVPKCFHAHQGLGGRFQALNDAHFNMAWKTARLDILLLPGLVLIASMGEWAVIRFGSEMILEGTITKGDFLAFHGYIAYLLFASIAVGFGVSTFNRGYTSFVRLRSRFEVDPEACVKSEEAQITPVFNPSVLSCEEMVFRYQGAHRDTLSISKLEIPLKGLIGICGPVGSGKSTFLRLLLRFYDPESGVFHLDGKPLQEYSRFDLRRTFALVNQDPFLLSRTIRENIEYYGRQDLSGSLREERLKSSVHNAALEQDISTFPNGLETIVGERGVRLSLGQKQRVSIARALFREKPVLLLDDPFSALDTITEERILNHLLEIKKQGAILLVSQRASTLKRCDRILIFDEGEFIREGSPEELLEGENFFRHIYEIQENLGGG